MAIAVLGSGVLAACSSDGAIAVDDAATGTDTTSTTGTDAGTTSTDSTTSTDTGSTDTAAPTEVSQLRWERVELGFVSAYVLARGSEIAIVDTGVDGSAPAIQQGLEALGATWSDVNNVILTHLHGDHVGSLGQVLDLSPNATAWAGRADAEEISGDVEALDDGDEIFGLQVIGTPGHTPGHISVLDPVAGLLVAGDAINEEGGMVLGPNPRFSNDMTQANASVQRLAERAYETVVFGHGNPIETGGSDAVVALAQTLS